MLKLKFRNSSSAIELLEIDKGGGEKTVKEITVIKGTINGQDEGFLSALNTRNVRVEDIKSKMAKTIRETASVYPSQMVFVNRGITAYVEDSKLKYKNNTLETEMLYIIDGGTTHAVIKDLHSSYQLPQNCILNIEIISASNLTKEEIALISKSRNTNNPPADYTIVYASGALDSLEAAIREDWRNLIFFKQNEDKKRKGEHLFPNRELLTYIHMIDPIKYATIKHLDRSFPDQKAGVKDYISDIGNGVKDITFVNSIVNDILRLHDNLIAGLNKLAIDWAESDSEEIPVFLRLLTNINGDLTEYFTKGMKLKGKKYNTLVSETKKSILKKRIKETIFTNELYRLEVPKQILYTFFGGIRANVIFNENDMRAEWVNDIYETFDNIFDSFITLLSNAIVEKPGAGLDKICNAGLSKDFFMLVMGEVMKK